MIENGIGSEFVFCGRGFTINFPQRDSGNLQLLAGLSRLSRLISEYQPHPKLSSKFYQEPSE